MPHTLRPGHFVIHNDVEAADLVAVLEEAIQSRLTARRFGPGGRLVVCPMLCSPRETVGQTVTDTMVQWRDPNGDAVLNGPTAKAGHDKTEKKQSGE